jgi:hypothetical protein
MSTQTALPIAEDGVRDVTHMARALRQYRAARSEMACTRRPVVLFDRATGQTLRLETMKEVRMLLFAAASAYRGARAAGLTEAANDVLREIRTERQRT